METKQKNDKTLWTIICVMFLTIVGLIAGVIIARILREAPKEDEYTWQLEKIEMNNLGIKNCGQIQRAYESGMVDRVGANDLYEDLYESVDNNDYKIYLAICYADYMFDIDGDLTVAVERVEKIRPLIMETDDTVSYYNAMIYFYEEAGREEEANRYREMLNDLVPVSNEVVDE